MIVNDWERVGNFVTISHSCQNIKQALEFMNIYVSCY